MKEKSSEIYKQQNIEEPRHKYTVEMISKFDEKTLEEILKVEQASFPEEMQEDIEGIKEVLNNEQGIQIIAKNEKQEIVSYFSSSPLEDVYKELKDYDSELKLEKDVLYVSSIGTMPEFRDMRILLKTFRIAQEQAKEKGFKKIAAHVRVKNGFSDLLQKKGAKKLRTIENWYNFGEPFDYLEIEL